MKRSNLNLLDKEFMNIGINLENIYHTKKRSESQSIPAICDAQNNRIYYNKFINETFKEFYCRLYASEQPVDAFDLMENLFSQLNLPTISTEQQTNLNAPVSSEEVGKSNLFIEHNSYTRQFKVLYSYIKSEEGK